MLQKGNATPQLKEWLDRLAPVVEDARSTLERRKPGKLVMYSGCEQDPDGNFRLAFFGQEYVISSADFSVQRADTDQGSSTFTQSLILTYLATADGTTPSSRWVGFREVPDGMFYAQAFRGYTGVRLVQGLEDEIKAFQSAAEALNGKPLDAIGDAGYAFTVLPRLHLAVVYWQGDEEFPSQARVLFEDTAANYMPSDGLAILGSQLVGRILKAAR